MYIFCSWSHVAVYCWDEWNVEKGKIKFISNIPAQLCLACAGLSIEKCSVFIRNMSYRHLIRSDSFSVWNLFTWKTSSSFTFVSRTSDLSIVSWIDSLSVFFYPPLFWQKPLFFEMVHVIRTGNCISTHCFYMKMLKYMRVVYLEYNFFFYFICRIIKSNYFIYEMIFIHGISFIAFTSFNICNYKIVGRHM